MMPSENQSSFMEMIGTQDILPKIIQWLGSLKDKVRIERVCRRFALSAFTFEAWSNIAYLHVMKNRRTGTFSINDEEISADAICSAVKAVIIRCRSVKLIRLDKCENDNIYASITDTILLESSLLVSFPNLRELRFGPDYSPIYLKHITALIKATQKQLTSIYLFGIDFHNTTDSIKFWNVVGKCAHLKIFEFQLVCDAWRKITPEMITAALRGKPIERLVIQYDRMKTNDLIEIICSCATQSVREIYALEQVGFSLVEFTSKLSSIQCAALDKISVHNYSFYSINKADSIWAVICDLPRTCPNLRVLELSFKISDDERISTVVELFITYLSIQNESSLRSSEPVIYVDRCDGRSFKIYGLLLKLCVINWNKIEVEEILTALTELHNCNVMFSENELKKQFHHVRLGQRGSIQFYPVV